MIRKIILLLFIISCKSNTDKIKLSFNENDTLYQNKTCCIDSTTVSQNDKIPFSELPFGSSKIKTALIPETDKFNEDTAYNSFDIEALLNHYTLFNLFSKEDSLKITSYNKYKTKYIGGLINPYNYYNFPIVSKKRKNSNSKLKYYCVNHDAFVKILKLPDFLDYSIFLYASFPKYYNLDCNGEYPVKFADLVIFSKEGKLIDAINIYVGTIELYDNTYTLSYINKEYKVYQKSFKYGETYEFLRKEQWQIRSNGKFARYYEKDGMFKNHEEQGEVVHTLREGKWIETKPNAYVNQKTYLEAEFKEGEKIGEWKFYSYKNNTKGELLYTETYKDGELVERVFIK